MYGGKEKKYAIQSDLTQSFQVYKRIKKSEGEQNPILQIFSMSRKERVYPKNLLGVFRRAEREGKALKLHLEE